MEVVKTEEITSSSVFGEGENCKMSPGEMGKFGIHMVALDLDAPVKTESPLVKVEAEILELFPCELCCRGYKSPWWLRLHKLIAHAPKVKHSSVSSPTLEEACAKNVRARSLNLKQDFGRHQQENTASEIRTTGSRNEMLPSAVNKPAKVLDAESRVDKCILRSGRTLTPGKSTDKLRCGLCSTVCMRKDFLQHHIREHSGGGETHPSKCSSCKFECSNRTELRLHVLIFHPSGLSNNGPRKKQDGKRKPQPSKGKGNKGRKNIKRAPAVTPIFECSFCDYSASRKSKVKAHEDRHVEESLNKYHCDQCPYRGPTKSSLKTHYALTHSNVPIFKCSICDYSSRKRASARLHDESHYNRPSPRLNSLRRSQHRCSS